MDQKVLLASFNTGRPIKAGSEAHQLLVEYSNKAMQITTDLNGSYHTPETRALMSELTGEQVDETFMVFPPFYIDFGKDIHIGKNVLINSCCNFRDQGGITIKEGALIGHKVVLATVNHGFASEDRHIRPRL